MDQGSRLAARNLIRLSSYSKSSAVPDLFAAASTPYYQAQTAAAEIEPAKIDFPDLSIGNDIKGEATEVASQTGAPKTVDGKKTRHEKFSYLTNQDIAFFKDLLGSENVLVCEDDIHGYVRDVTKKYQGIGSIVMTPTTTEQVSECLKYCNERMIAVVPQGGNTGLVGGGVPLHDEVVISTNKMNKIHSLDEVQGTLTCESGCILQVLQEYCQERGYMMPLDLGAKGSCQIGGNLATNAGGIKFIKQGSMHANCIGLKVVLADGTIIDQMNPHE